MPAIGSVHLKQKGLGRFHGWEGRSAGPLPAFRGLGGVCAIQVPEAVQPAWQTSGMAWHGRPTVGDEAVGLHQVPEVVDDVLQATKSSC